MLSVKRSPDTGTALRRSLQHPSMERFSRHSTLQTATSPGKFRVGSRFLRSFRSILRVICVFELKYLI